MTDQSSAPQNRGANGRRDHRAVVLLLLCLASYLFWLFNSFAVSQFLQKIAELSNKYVFR
jgi:hypothetical protein